MNIGIFETAHYEGSYPVIRLFDIAGNNITIFTNETCYRQFTFLFGNDMKRYTWVVQTPQQSKYEFIDFLGKEVARRNIDLLYLNTVTDNHFLYARMISSLKNVRVILTLHDINGYFEFKPAFSLRRYVRHIGKRNLINKVNEFNVVSDTMVAHLQNKLQKGTTVHNIPGCVFDPSGYVAPHLKQGDEMKIVVPGSIDPRRRDYRQVFELLQHINSNNIHATVTLLGGSNSAEGAEIINECRQYSASHNNLVFFENEIVDQPMFDKLMNEAHFVFLPTVHHTILFDGITEIYGESICSGNIFDVIKHARPAIIPAFLKIPGDLESSFYRYNTIDDVIKFLASVNYDEWKPKAFSNAMHFTAESIRAKNPALFEPE